jgi:HD-GYP domain-containing protein (c-di-GMP phosphodiesterase class II)
VERWAPVLGRLGDGPTTVPVLGMASRDASVDVTPALALGVTDLLTYPCNGDDLVERVTSSMRGRRSGRGPDRSEPASPLAQLRTVTEAAEEALLRTETAVARVSRAEERDHLRQARDSLSHSLQVILGTMIGSAEAAGPGREGHSRRVASITRDLTDSLGWPPLRVRGMELAGLFLDIGMLVLPADLLAPTGPLEPDAVELLHGHADLSGDILEPLARVGLPVAAGRAHHERLDGSGYPRGLSGDAISPAGRILAAADVYQALTESRPHRPARTPEAAASELRAEVAAKRLDGDAADAVLRSAGHRVRRRKEWPSGLTSREVEVLRLAARGLSNKEIARSLVISSKTTGTHVEHIYTKIGVSNRAQASLFAMKHGLMTDSGPETWPPERPPQRSGERPM